MIADREQYESTQEELRFLEDWVQGLQSEPTKVDKGLTKASVLKKIARLRDELAAYKGEK